MEFEDEEDVKEFAQLLTKFAKGVSPEINERESFDLIYYTLLTDGLDVMDMEELGVHVSVTSLIQESEGNH